MLSLKEKLEPKPLTTTGNHYPVSTVENQVIWLKNARPPRPDAPSVTGLEEVTSQDAPKDQRSE